RGAACRAGSDACAPATSQARAGQMGRGRTSCPNPRPVAHCMPHGGLAGCGHVPRRSAVEPGGTMNRLVARGRRWLLAGLVGPLLAAGCAPPEPVARPADFPYHGSDGRYRLHWRLDRESWRARAVGVVESPRVEDTERDLVVELRGLDKDGR